MEGFAKIKVYPANQFIIYSTSISTARSLAKIIQYILIHNSLINLRILLQYLNNYLMNPETYSFFNYN